MRSSRHYRLLHCPSPLLHFPVPNKHFQVCTDPHFARLQELLKYKGLQIAPAELENLLFTHPLIAEACVIGVPSPSDPGSDLPRAYVVPVHTPSKISEEEVQDFVKGRVAEYKQLRGGVVFVDELPKNAIGKYLRRELRERAKREVGGGGKAKL